MNALVELGTRGADVVEELCIGVPGSRESFLDGIE